MATPQPSQDDKIKLVLERYPKLTGNLEVRALLGEMDSKFYGEHTDILEALYLALTHPDAEYVSNTFESKLGHLRKTGEYEQIGAKTTASRDRVRLLLAPLNETVLEIKLRGKTPAISLDSWLTGQLVEAVASYDPNLSDALRDETSYLAAKEAVRNYFTEFGGDQPFRYERKLTPKEMIARLDELKKEDFADVGEFGLLNRFKKNFEGQDFDKVDPAGFYRELEEKLEVSRKHFGGELANKVAPIFAMLVPEADIAYEPPKPPAIKPLESILQDAGIVPGTPRVYNLQLKDESGRAVEMQMRAYSVKDPNTGEEKMFGEATRVKQ